MLPEDYRDKVKRRLSIPSDVLDFDDDLIDYVTEAVNNLWPVLQKESNPDNYSMAAGDHTITLPSPMRELRKIEYKHGQDPWLSYQGHYIQHGDTIILDESFGMPVTLKLYGTEPYDAISVPPEFTQVIIAWVMSEFYSMLVGNKSKYNIYMQTSGARGVDNMRDLSDYYLDRGNQILMDRTQIRGQ